MTTTCIDVIYVTNGVADQIVKAYIQYNNF